MNEEELFCKLFPEYAVNGKPLSPYIDLFESGYEQAEKRIAELEKKNTALRQDWEIMKNTISEYNDFCDKYISLEKENAELKHIIATLRQEKDNVSMHAKAMEVVAKTRSDQLTKAKELIKDMYDAIPSSHSDYYKDVIERARQFLSEVEK